MISRSASGSSSFNLTLYFMTPLAYSTRQFKSGVYGNGDSTCEQTFTLFRLTLYFTATCVLICFRRSDRNEASRSRRCNVRDNGSLRSRHKVISEQSVLYSSLSAASSSSSATNFFSEASIITVLQYFVISMFCTDFPVVRVNRLKGEVLEKPNISNTVKRV